MLILVTNVRTGSRISPNRLFSNPSTLSYPLINPQFVLFHHYFSKTLINSGLLEFFVEKWGFKSLRFCLAGIVRGYRKNLPL